MLVRGFVFSGVMRGQPLVEIYYDRISGIIGFHPFKGTLDVKLGEKVDIAKYSSKALDHLLMDGKRIVNLRLAPINLTANDLTLRCWCMQQENGVYGRDVIEVLAEERLKDVMKIDDRQFVEVEFFELQKEKKPGLLSKLKK